AVNFTSCRALIVVGAPIGVDGRYVSLVPSTAPTIRHGGSSSKLVRSRCLTATYSWPSAAIGGICWCAESHHASLASTLKHWFPPQRPTGFVDLIGLPERS